jgi:uncharacterized membrane protein YfcA
MIYILLVVIISYLVIALWRHHRQGDLNPKIVLEYFLFALLGAAFVLSIISFQ